MKQMFAALIAASLLSAPALAKTTHAHHAMKATHAHHMTKTSSKMMKHKSMKSKTMKKAK